MRVPKFGPKVGEKTNQELLNYPKENYVKIECENSQNVSNVHISYYPSIFCHLGISGQNGQFVVLYDVKREENGSELQVL